MWSGQHGPEKKGLKKTVVWMRWLWGVMEKHFVGYYNEEWEKYQLASIME